MNIKRPANEEPKYKCGQTCEKLKKRQRRNNPNLEMCQIFI